MGVLKFRPDANSPWSEIPALVGPPGPSPVRGTDYWTEDDKNEIINNLKSDETICPKVTVVTLLANQWDSNLTQSVTINGILADETQQAIFVNPVYINNNVDIVADCNIYASAQGDGFITFSCDEIPTEDVKFNVKWEKVNYI